MRDTMGHETNKPARPPRPRRLRPQNAVAVIDAACLPVRLAASSCRACIDACPTGALELRDGRVELSGECLQCGRCHAACPTGAVQVAGFAAQAQPSPGTAPLRIACWKTTSGGAPAETIRVPCLFGLADAQIVDWRASTLPRPFEWIDNGWCQACSAGCGQSPAAAFAPAIERLRDLGLADELQPRPFADHLPASAMPAEIPDPSSRRRMGRRDFFAGLVRESLVPVTISAATRAPEDIVVVREGNRSAAGRRRQLVDGLRRIGLASGVSRLPEAMLPHLSLDAACCASGVCAAHCPTGALRRREESDEYRLEFDGSACIGCLHCQLVCPQHALQVKHSGGYQKVTVLRTDAMRRCTACGVEFSGTTQADGAESELCAHCFKSRRLARSAFSQLFGARG